MKTQNDKVELLAPAGSFQGFIGALNAGADAVYLAGKCFGARAYADNFTTEEIEEAILLGGLFGVKIYLTVNTLLKNRELDELYDYIKPLYVMGLKGVIVQDFGVFQFLRRNFPELELHVSTQMCITSLEGAEYITHMGAKRVVPARELTLSEITEITGAGVETECFIHGSMCYCYSGQCLFSSLIGGRSGNRGRCAQPCRLPYGTNGKEGYCLSLKDMCTLEHIPKLIDAGIASFKIEGRMKNPAYAAWVTTVYRKYIDLYVNNPDKEYKVEKQDLDKLKTLYIRSELQDGYYRKYRGKDMITMDNPAYSKTDDGVVAEITEKFILKKPKCPIQMTAEFEVGQVCSLEAIFPAKDNVYKVKVTGDVVQEVVKAPLSEEAIRERLSKTGDYPFQISKINIFMSGTVFLPVKAVNELRRKALDALLDAVKEELQKGRQIGEKEVLYTTANTTEAVESMEARNCSEYIVFTETKEQFKVVLKTDYVKRVVVPLQWVDNREFISLWKTYENVQKELYFALPALCRQETWDEVHCRIKQVISNNLGAGVYVNQVDSMAYVKKHFPGLLCVGDLHMYGMNREAIAFLNESLDGFTVSAELNKDELRHLNLKKGELILYGRTPLMHTANCIFLTTDKCRKNLSDAADKLRDKTGAIFPYRGHCREKVCYNTIYNSVPTSLHKQKNEINKLSCNRYQIRFTTEQAEEIRTVLDIYQQYANGNSVCEVPFSYTNGHFLRGVQ